MISSLDRALLAMSLEEEDVPFVLPDLPQYNSCQKKLNQSDWKVIKPRLSEDIQPDQRYAP